MSGAWNKILKVDLSEKTTTVEELDEEIIKKYLGGNGLGIRLLHEETEGEPRAFSEENPLIFVPGALNGSKIPMTEKCGFYSKSPLTGIMAEGIFGGSLGEEVKKAGFDAIVIKGKSNKTSYLSIEKNGISINEATELKGIGTKKAEEILKKRHGGSAVVIGPAGENLVKYAIITGDDREVGRTGLGAVMGWKNLKGIVVDGWKEIESADPKKVNELKSQAFSEFTEEDGAGKESFDAYSSHGTVKFGGMASELGIFPTKYWESGSFEDGDKLSSYHWEDDISESKGCHRCPCRCGQVYKDIVDVEYETSFALGSNLLIGDIEEVAKANHLCDELGMDTISAGNTLGFLMKLSEEGVIEEDFSFGDDEKVKELLRKTAYREGLGDIAAEGVKRVGVEFGREEIAVHVNGLSPPAYDPRGVKGMGLAYYTSTRGACHLRSDCDGIELGGGMTSDDEGRWVHMERDSRSVDDKEYVAWRENYITLHDTLGSCKLTGRSVYSPEMMSEFVDAHLGLDLNAEDIYRLGERIYNMERLYGLKQKPEIKDKIHVPEQFSSPTPVEGLDGETFTKAQVEKMLKDYYKERGWNEEGIPTDAKLEELDIEIKGV
ncbi:MAG: aldehyde ferredoxin oxidoreductase family protein [Candidatus Thermoplasmatota archaeon]|nr:aldehyde ferredoxin oxidoreductase family protein [Candidatus Thermoplasmatota archaeon]MBS3789704.1 aldehyde ferredoxin oxidoreductase family protein [Candidatus Thermoplasmatota archaeon]